MPVASKVHHSKFPNPRILYEDRHFAIAYGTYDGKQKCIGMRWSGGPNDPGYPKLFQHPVWFVLPKTLSGPIVKALIGVPNAKNKRLVRVLEEL